ncbi:MAG: hypothetical protein M3P04_06145 [Actinomycetota bacterium]|nr:hypothetical protein [Actinomycetota bacterium]
MTGRAPLSSRLLQSPRVGFGLTTLALVALASGGTSILVSHGTNQLQPDAPRVTPSRSPSPAAAPVLVERAPGSLLPTSLTGRRAPARPAPVSRSETVAPQVVEVVPPQPVVVPVPVVAPPVVAPPVVEPPVVEPPVVGPFIEPPTVDPDTLRGSRPGRRAHPPHPPHPDDNGKHLGQLKH